MRIPARLDERENALHCRDAAGPRPYHVTLLVISLWILAVVARVVFIDQPYIDHWSWRQIDVAAIARNFAENGFRFGYPQIDWAGSEPGYVGTEFPILPFIAAICSKIADDLEPIGRGESIILFAASLPFFFFLVRKSFGSTAAIWATFFYGFAPLNVFAGRSFMPDVPSLSLALIGLYFFLCWIENGKSAPLSVAAIFISSSFLLKLTSIVIAAPLLCVVWQKWRWNFVKRSDLWLFAAITILPSVAWYWHAHEIAKTFYPHHFFGEGGIRIENFSWYLGIARRTATSSLTPVLSILALIGLFVGPRSRYSPLFHWWLAGMIAFIIIFGYGNRHPWYQLPLVPIAAAFAGAACAFIESKIGSFRIAILALSILLVFSFVISAYLYVRPLYESSAAELRDAGLELNKITTPDALIVAADTGDPTIFYYANRKGWHFLEKDGIYNGNPTDGQQAITNLEQLHGRGASHLVLTANTFWWLEYHPDFARYLDRGATLIEATPRFKIYKLPAAAE